MFSAYGQSQQQQQRSVPSELDLRRHRYGRLRARRIRRNWCVVQSENGVTAYDEVNVSVCLP